MKADGPIQHDSVAGARPRPWLAATVLAVAICGVYGRALDVPFIFDDIAAITKNRSITSLWPLVGTTAHRGPLNPPPQTPVAARPLVNLSFALNYVFNGLSPTAFHAVNVAIHFLSALLLWSITQRTLRLPFFEGRFERPSGWIALVVALIWALHPIQTEAVIYATQRTELMFAFFYLATFYCSLRYWTQIPLPLREGPGEGSSPSKQARKEREKQPSRPNKRTPTADSHTHDPNRRARTAWLILAVTSCAAGMASKEVMVSAPVMVLLYERTFLTGSLAKALRRSWPLYVGLFSTWILVIALNHGAPRSQSAGFNLEVTAYSWWLTQTKVLLMYAKLLIWPFPLLIHYEFAYFKTFGEAWPYVLPVLLLGIGTLVLLWRNSPIGYLGTWAFAILSPTLLIPIITEVAAERRMYLPLAAIVAIVVIGGYQLAQNVLAKWQGGPRARTQLWPRLLAVIPALVLVIAFGWVSADRLKAYYDEPGLWQDVLRYYPNDFMVQSYRGNWLAKSGKPAEAVDAYLLSLNHAPDDVEVLNNLAVVLMRTNRVAEGIASAQRALELQPSSIDARMTLGLLYKRAGRLPEAIEELKTALAPYPNDVEILNQLGDALVRAQRFPEAIETMQRAVRLHPENTEAHFQLGSAFAGSGDNEQAIGEFRRVVELDPNYVEAYHNLGVLVADSGNPNDAIFYFEQAVRLQPNLAQARFALAEMFRKSGRPQEAIATAQKAIEVARSNGQAAAAQQMEQWLEQYQRDSGQTTNQPSPKSNR